MKRAGRKLAKSAKWLAIAKESYAFVKTRA
jgi:hypothetical protein